MTNYHEDPDDDGDAVRDRRLEDDLIEKDRQLKEIEAQYAEEMAARQQQAKEDRQPPYYGD